MKKVVKFLPLISAVVAALALLSLFLPVFTATAKTGEFKKFPGMAVLIGHTKELAPGYNGRVLDASLLQLIPYALTVVGVALAALSFWKKNDVFVWVAVASLLVAGICYFLPITFAKEGKDWLMPFTDRLTKVVDLGYGAILAGICSILGACGMVAHKVLNK